MKRYVHLLSTLYFFKFYWLLVDLQCCVSFKCTEDDSVIQTHSSVVFRHFSHKVIAEHWLEFPALCSRALLVVPRWFSGEECRGLRFGPWVGKIPWRREQQPTPVFLPGDSHGQRSLASYSPWGHKDSDTIWRLSTHIVVCACSSPAPSSSRPAPHISSLANISLFVNICNSVSVL